MRLHSASSGRPGITLLEVLVSTAMFLFSLVAIGELMSSSADQALEVNQLTKATRLCQSKLNEYIAGVEDLKAPGGGEFEEEPGWRWAAESNPDSTAINLYKVVVTVTRETPRGKVEVSMGQFVYDAAQKGQLADRTPEAEAATPATGTTGGTATTGGASR